MRNWKIFVAVSLGFLAFEALVVANPTMVDAMIVTYFLAFVALAGIGYLALGFMSGSWCSLLIALVPLAAMYAIGFDDPFAGYTDPGVTVAPMKEAWIWLTAFVFVPVTVLGVALRRVLPPLFLRSRS